MIHGRKLGFVLFLWLVGTVPVYAQGFGVFSQKTVTINRLLPPTVNLKGKKVRVEATADAIQKDGELLRSLLRTKLTTMIQKDPRFIVNESSPQTILRFTITNFYTESWTKMSNNVQVVSYGGKLEVSYQAIDAATNAPLDSENLVQTAGVNPNDKSTSFTEIFHASASSKKKEAAESSENETRDQLTQGIVEQMGRRIAPLDEPIVVPLPVKKLEPISSLALTNRWAAVEEQAEKADKFPKPEDDAYRLYLVALAKEALAYDLTREANERDLGKRDDISPAQAEAEFQTAQKDLDEAGAIYKQIITANPKEKEFRPGDARTEEAIAIYAKIERFKAENARIAAAKQQSAPAGAAAGAPPAAPTVSPFDQVLDFCVQGMDGASIKDYIDSDEFLSAAKSAHYTFSFTRDSARLNQACKTNAAMLQKEIRARLTPSAPAKK